MFTPYVAHVLVLLSALAQALPSVRPTTHGDGRLFPRTGDPRDVYVQFEYLVAPRSTGSDGKTRFPYHSALYVEGNKKDGPLKIEIIVEKGEYYLSHYDMTPRLNDVGNSKVKGLKKTYRQGSTILTNDEFLDVKGNGIVWDELTRDYEYRSGAPNQGKMNTCHDINTRILKRLNIPISTEAEHLFGLYDTWSVTVETKKISKPIKSIIVRGPYPNPKKKDAVTIRRHDINPDAPGKSGCKRSTKRDGSCTPKPITTEGGDDVPMQNELGGYEVASQIPAEELDIAATDPDTTVSAGKPPPPDTVSDGKGNTKVSVVRAGGTLMSFTAVGKETLGALGVAGSVVGAVFVILDFVHHEWVGGAIGGIGLAVGVAAGIAVSGPVGWVIGGAIAALFAILPGLFKDPKSLADRIDPQGII